MQLQAPDMKALTTELERDVHSCLRQCKLARVYHWVRLKHIL